MTTNNGTKLDSILIKPENEEHIGRQIQAAVPIRTMYGETQRRGIADGIRGQRYSQAFLDEGAQANLTTPEEREEFANTLDRLKYGAENILMHDLATGIWSAVTNPKSKAQNSFYHVGTLIDSKSGAPARLTVTLSREAIYKLALGPLVDDNGRAIKGAGTIVDHQKDRLAEYLDKGKPIPMAISSVHTNAKGQAIIVKGVPVAIHAMASGAGKQLFSVELDNAFFPIIERDKDDYIATERFLHTVAGLSSVLGLGRYILSSRGMKDLPQVPAAHKTMLFLQAAFELRAFSSELVQYNPNNGRYNIASRRYATVRELMPGAIQNADRAKTPWIRYKLFSDFISNNGLMFLTALDELGITQQLSPDMVMPAIDKGAEFPDRTGYEKIVYLKADKLKKEAENKDNSLDFNPFDPDADFDKWLEAYNKGEKHLAPNALEANTD